MAWLRLIWESLRLGFAQARYGAHKRRVYMYTKRGMRRLHPGQCMMSIGFVGEPIPMGVVWHPPGVPEAAAWSGY